MYLKKNPQSQAALQNIILALQYKEKVCSTSSSHWVIKKMHQLVRLMHAVQSATIGLEGRLTPSDPLWHRPADISAFDTEQTMLE